MNRMDIAAELATELDNAIDEPELANEMDKASDEAINAPRLDAMKALAASLGMDFKSFIDAQYHAMAACTGSASDRGASSSSGPGVTPLFGSTPSSSGADGGVKPDDADGADAEADKGDDAATEPHTPYKDDDAVSISSSQATTLQWGGFDGDRLRPLGLLGYQDGSQSWRVLLPELLHAVGPDGKGCAGVWQGRTPAVQVPEVQLQDGRPLQSVWWVAH